MTVGGDYRLGTADPVMILEFAVTTWCNYTCAYGVTTVQQRRGEAVHAFDRHAAPSTHLAHAAPSTKLATELDR